MFCGTSKSHHPSSLSSIRFILSFAICVNYYASAAAPPPLSSSANSPQLIKVLVVSNHDKQHALEEAASLSLDVPVYETGSGGKDQDSAANQSSRGGYQKTSLASLTLHQLDTASNEASPTIAPQPQITGASQSRKENGTINHQVPRVPRHEQQQQQQQQQDPWSELYLPRLRPTWLNVSSRFKITGATIEEEKFLIPSEYFLRSAFDSPILLKTKLGIIEGVRSIKFNKHLYTFLSVPYAKAPIGELRFKAPQQADKWDGIYQATKWPPFCVQPSMTLASKSSPVHILTHIMSEDCLYMNIWTPSLKLNRNRKRPVMVWIHGGAFQYGGISVDENDGSALALLGDVVVVTLNYRISAFGFLNANNQKNAPNNVGIQDQRAAMEWVQANIKQFGGDPQQVTLFGESAGGHSVGLHMISPASQPLFKRAILQSGVPVSFLRSYDVNNDNRGSAMSEGVSSIMMAKRLGCYNYDSPTSASEAGETTSTSVTESTANSTTGENNEANDDTEEPEEEEDGPILNDITVACMRNKSSLEILKAMGTPGNSGFFPTGNDRKGVFPNGPIMDSFDPEAPKIGPQKDYLLGINSDEGTFMLHYGMPSVFPARSEPNVTSVDGLKAAITRELERQSKVSLASLVTKNNNSDIQSASGDHQGGAQAHLYKPLLRTSTTMLESFMAKSQSDKSAGTGGGSNKTGVHLSREAEFGKNVASLITDIIFLCPARTLARTLAEANRNVYFYLYTHRSSLSQYHDWLGVTHHDEVEFVFGRPIRLADVYSGKDIEMSQRMIKTWSHFAYTGQMLDQFGVKWPKYGDEDNNYMVLGMDQASVGQRYHDRVCNIYDTVISVHLQDGR